MNIEDMHTDHSPLGSFSNLYTSYELLKLCIVYEVGMRVIVTRLFRGKVSDHCITGKKTGV